MVNSMIQEVEFGQLSRSDGSASVKQGHCSAVASVHGPAEVRIRDEQPDRATLQVTVYPLKGVGEGGSGVASGGGSGGSGSSGGPYCKATANSISKALCMIIALHLHPRTLFQVTIQTTCRPSTRFNSNKITYPSDPFFCASEAAAQFNAAICALLNAAAPMHGTAFAASLCINDDETDDKKLTIIHSPSPAQEKAARASIAAAFVVSSSVPNLSHDQPIWIQTSGILTPEELLDALELLHTDAIRIREEILKKQYT